MNTSSTIKKNFVWSSILTVAGYIFPLITFPYVTRVLGVEGIGNYQFASSTIQYFSIFAMLGINTIGIREIARVKPNRVEMSRVFSSLILLNLITVFISIAALCFLSFIIPSFIEHRKLLFIGIAQILCGSFLVEWFFKGIEDFQYITIRAILVRCVYVVCVFVFVKEREDYITYFFLTTLITVVNAVINITHSNRFVDFSLKSITIRPIIKPFIVLGVYQILTAMYISFNVIFLGAKCGDIEVGYYTAATKLFGVIMSLFTAFTGVMMPRMSSLVSEGKTQEFKTMTNKSIDFLLLFCLPIIMIAEVYAPEIIRIIAGEGFDGAIVPMRVVMPLMLVIGYEQIIIIQMLSPLRRDNAILTNSCVGAAVAMVLNLTIVENLGSLGSAIVWFCSEVAVLISAQYFIAKYVNYHFPLKKFLTSTFALLPSILICICIDRFVTCKILSVCLACAAVSLYWIIIEYYVIKNQVLINNIRVILRKI